MRRRAVLRGGLGLAGLAGLGRAGAALPLGRSDAQASADYEPLGRRRLPGTADCRVTEDGRTAFVAVGDGFAAVRLPELAVVDEVRSIEADREDGPLAGIADVALHGDRLLVPGPSGPRPGRITGFALFDVSQPDAPEQVAFYETDFPIHNAALDDDRAYLTAVDSLVIVDLADDDPVEAGRWALTDINTQWADVPLALRVLHDMRVRGDLAVLSQWDAGTWLVDVSTPDDVVVVGRAGGQSAADLADVPTDEVRRAAVGLPGNHHSAALSPGGTLLAVGAEAFATGDGEDSGRPGGIDLYDLADPATPDHLATIDAPRAADETTDGTWTTVHDFAFAGDRLLSAWYQGGVRIHDVADPADPRELTWWRQPREAAFWTARPAAGDTFVASATSLPDDALLEGLYLFPNRPGEQADPPSLTDPSTPTETPTPTASPSPTPSPRSSPTPTPTPTPTGLTGRPSYGPLAVLGGLAGLAAWYQWRRRRSS